ncbi:dUTP diphosphatase [Paracoccus alkanivorans]|uniref:dUTP diphosphatase n=1 Tax=Paracoccus alkanivorans TaxID=2116655 RepID=A0A3M0M6Q6_9RHOB|nr:dUTP diphosphatase [Paracoccus alkanivorans]RMC32863.1 dUTP diphosphatase [Paracoccus alkanivorans]
MEYQSTNVEVKVLDPRLRNWGLPRYQSTMAAGIDLFACPDAPVTIPPGAPAVLIPSGMAIHIADPLVTAVIVPRSGLGHKKGLVLGNLIGVVDADYTGQVFISVWNRSGPDTQPIVIEPGERIAQMLFVPVLRPSFSVVQEFSATTQRGEGGFGSTGVDSSIETGELARPNKHE